MSPEAIQIVYALGGITGMLASCTDANLAELEAWARAQLAVELAAPALQLIEAERDRRRNVPHRARILPKA